MSTLKDLRDRKKSIQSTQKITLAMKMVAAAKLRRAQEQAEAGRPYARHMDQILSDLAGKTQMPDSPQPLLTGTGRTAVQLLVLAASDRGLCGAFNASLVRYTKSLILSHQEAGKEVKIICVGRKGQELLEKDYGALIIERICDLGHPSVRFTDAEFLANILMQRFEKRDFDVCTLIYSQFKSAMTQKVIHHQVIPLVINQPEDPAPQMRALYEYEPQEETLLQQVLPQNLTVQIYNALLENTASEHGARMTAMDNASRNASEMLRKLMLLYNRTRQTHITRELIEIISGAETLRERG